MLDSQTRSLISTKIQRPRVGRRLVVRPRLVAQLSPPNSLTFILAPAGYGKTTLLSVWLETCQMPIAWLSLDERDDDLAVFVTSLAEALHSVLPAVADNTITALNGMTLPPPEVLAQTVLNDLVLIQQDFILVLDDYHVIFNRAIHDLLLELVSHPPQALHLVIASRYDPPFPLPSLRAHGHVTELRGGDLRFTLEEAGQFLAETMALTLDEQTISVLAAKTEGWPAGLRLAALSLRQQKSLDVLAPDGLGHSLYIMDYLVAEVLWQLPLSVQDFLVKTSVLDQLCRPLCEAVTSMVDLTFNDQPILEWLERADFFLTAVDDQRHWYRYHHLFRHFLRDRLKQQYGSAEIAALHLRASTWFADNGYLDEALQHALAADDETTAVQIIAQHRHEMMNQAQWRRLDRWAHLFPREVIDAQPDLLLIEIWISFIQQRLSDVPALLDRVEALLPRLPAEAASNLQGEVESRRSALLYWRGDLARSLILAQQALEKIPLTWWYVRAYTRLFLGAGYQITGDLIQAYATCYETGEPDQGPGYWNLLMGSACILHWIAADLVSSARTARQVISNSTPSEPAELITFSHFYLGYSYYQRNDLITAEKYLLPLIMQPYAVHAACFLNSAVVMAHIRQMQSRAKEALEIAKLVESFTLEIRSEVLLFGVRAFQAELALRQGRLAEASQWSSQLSAPSGSFRHVPIPFPFAPPIVQAKILLAQNTPASRRQACDLLSQMAEYFTSIHYTVIVIQVLALQAMLFNAEGDEPQALAVLARSIALAKPGGFLRLFVDLGTALKPLLQKLAQRGVAPTYLAEIIAAFEAEEAWPGAGPSLRQGGASTPPGSTLLTNREQEILELLAKRYTDKEIAETLVISPSTVSSHLDHLGNKLGVHGRRAIVQAAKDQGLLA